jgi:hypothetical protein
MLGIDDSPYLLVETDANFNRNHFDFWVVNGAWNGVFRDSRVYIERDKEPVDHVVTILTDNQDRLRGEYQTVFNNFGDENYVAPKPIYTAEDFEDDDIAF